MKLPVPKFSIHDKVLAQTRERGRRFAVSDGVVVGIHFDLEEGVVETNYAVKHPLGLVVTYNEAVLKIDNRELPQL